MRERFPIMIIALFLLNGTVDPRAQTAGHAAGDSLMIRLETFSSDIRSIESDSTEMLVDRDGNIYQTTRIGDRVWMAENLNTSRFGNGDPISEARSEEDWARVHELGDPAWSYYDNDPELRARYGRLYSREVIDDDRSLCPGGWRVPTEQDWMRLETALGMSQQEAGKLGWRGSVSGMLRSTRTEPDPHPRWDAPNTGATNESGFSALPAGYRTGRPNYEEQQEHAFRMLGGEVAFWSAEGGARALWADREEVYRGGSQITEGFGFSVRCIKEENE